MRQVFANVDKPVLIKNSLDQGLDITNFSIQVNSLRNGAYSRGALTALAGADVDLIGRIFQNVRILADFCGRLKKLSLCMLLAIIYLDGY